MNKEEPAPDTERLQEACAGRAVSRWPGGCSLNVTHCRADQTRGPCRGDTTWLRPQAPDQATGEDMRPQREVERGLHLPVMNISPQRRAIQCLPKMSQCPVWWLEPRVPAKGSEKFREEEQGC